MLQVTKMGWHEFHIHTQNRIQNTESEILLCQCLFSYMIHRLAPYTHHHHIQQNEYKDGPHYY